MTPIAAGLARLLADALAEPPRPPQALRLEVATVRAFPGPALGARTTGLGEDRVLYQRTDG